MYQKYIKGGSSFRLQFKNYYPSGSCNVLYLKILQFSYAIRGFSVNLCIMTQNPIVTIREGKLRGSVKKLFDGTPYYSFKGIPYAEPPVGNLRFQATNPAKPWDGVRDALKHGAVCPQYDINTSSFLEGNEDCLFLNVYTKSLSPSSKMPVMVYLHGGAFISGSGNSDAYGPEFLCQHDVLLITLNYRLEALGFLSLDTPDIPGNAGLKDQVLALKWVKENVAQFGGDPDNVTLFGESAGGAAVTYHMLSPMSRGLFHKAIAQSGVCTQDWAIGSAPRERAFRAGKMLGKDTRDPTELANFLRSLPATDLARITLATRTDDEKFRGLPMHFVPIIEKKFDNVESFITENPVNLLMEEKAVKVPFLFGYNSGEGLMPLLDQLKKTDVLNKNPSFLLPKEIAHKLPKEKVKELGERLKRYYLGDKDICKETSQLVADMQTDRQFTYHIHRFANYYSKYNKSTYLYKFDWVTSLNVPKMMLGYGGMRGACHADDLFYLFSTPLTATLYEEDETARRAIDTMTKLWTDFAKTGNPTPAPSATPWRPYTPSGGEYLLLCDDVTSGAHADRDSVAFWNQMYAEAGLPCIVHSRL